MAKRHLAYFLMPVRGPIWRWNADVLRPYLPQFDGRRLAAVVTADPTGRFQLDPVAEVAAALPGMELIEVVNNPGLREGAGWSALWAALLPVVEPDDLIFFAHAKGVTREPQFHRSVKFWTAALYEVLLADPTAVEEALAERDIAGAIRLTGRAFAGNASAWHYPGSFYWLRGRAVLRPGVLDLSPHTHCIESWPGERFPVERSACLLLDMGQWTAATAGRTLYAESFAHRVLLPALERWRRSRWGLPAPPGDGRLGGAEDVLVLYADPQGQARTRRVRPLPDGLCFGTCPWAPGAQWLLDVFDYDQRAVQTLALAGVHGWSPAPPPED
jgi:hypothetical protein